MPVSPKPRWGGARYRAGAEPIAITYDGRTLTVAAWLREPECRTLGLTKEAIYSRLHGGWDHERILTTPIAARAKQRDRVEAAAVDLVTPWEADHVAQAFVAAHPDGATLEEIGEAVGLVRESVRLIESAALWRLRRACERLGLDASLLTGGRGASDLELAADE